MKSFFKTFFASTLGVLFAIFILSIISFISLMGILATSGSPAYTVKDNTVFRLDLKGAITDKNQSSPLYALLGMGESMVEADIIASIKKAKEDDKIKGIYLKADLLVASYAGLEPIRKALIDFKESGKFIIAYSECYLEETYLLASVADKVVLNPKGIFEFDGIASLPVFRKNMYDKLGVKYQVFKVGTFKSAVEPYIQEKMSDANREQRSSYMNDIWKHYLNSITENRGISAEMLNAYADKGLMFAEPEEILSYGLVDTLMFENGMEDYIKNYVGVEKAEDVAYASLGEMKSVPAKKEKIHKDKIAVLYAEGQIVNDIVPASPLTAGTAMIYPRDVATELKKLQEDEDVKAVVFRVNSPGGSASASEQIWHAVAELKSIKPVIVSMGEYAASGGYYISCGATSIVAEPTTLTGSIGIFGLVPDGTELAQKMGLSFDELGTNKFSTFGGQSFGIPLLISAYSRGFTEEESALMQNSIERGYDLFITRCADGRGMTKTEIDAIGQGRVWSGAQAKENGLVDELGGVKEAIKLAAGKAGIEQYTTVRYPAEKDFMAKMMEEMMGSMEIRLLKTFMGKDAYQQQSLHKSLNALEFQQAIMTEGIAY
jgi:protease-4